MSAPGAARTVSGAPAAAPAPGTRWRHRAAAWTHTHVALIVLLLVPLAVFGVPQLFGLVFLDGDNLIQNFPLRVLAGRDLGHGVLPLWNPYLFSGTPLLAGFNAGAAYPATWLMAVLPIFTAWTLTLAAAYDVALVGMYLFLRRQGIGSAAATFGAATYTFAGYMSAQIVHVDLIQGAAWLPWMLLSVHGLSERTDDARADPPVGLWSGLGRVRGWVALLAISFGLSILTGGVEATIDGVLLLVIYWGGRLQVSGYLRWTDLRALFTPVAGFLLGLAGGVALGTAQLLPGGIFTAHSQRAGHSYAFFTSGSLPERLVTLLVSPFVLGTNQFQPGLYVGPYNFPEVTGYVGILALIAACALPVRRWRTRPESRHWRVWYVVLAVGLLSALGNQTYFGRLLYVVPGLNSERLLNRNLLLVDCSLAVLLAWWTHFMLTAKDSSAPEQSAPSDPSARFNSTIRSWWRGGRRGELVATCAPLVLGALLCLALWVAGPSLYHLLEATVQVSEVTRVKVAVLVTVGTIIAGAATWIVLSEARFTARTLRRLLAAVLAADLVVFNLFMVRPPVEEAQAQAKGPVAAAFQAVVGPGRFIVFDPDRFWGDQLLELGQTDLNVFNHLPSAQGYTALTDADYYQATGAHLQEDLRPDTLAGPVWDDLNVTTLVSLPSYFVTPVLPPPAPSPAPVANGFPFPTDVLAGQAPSPGADGPFPVDRGAVRRWYFGGVLTLDSWTLPVDRGAGRVLRVGLLSTTGGLQWLPTADVHRSGPAGHRSVQVTLPTPVRAGGVVVQAGTSGRLVVGAPRARTAEAGDVTLDGMMQPGVTHPHWAFTGTLGPFGIFHNTAARGWAWLEGPSGGSAPAGSTVSAATGDAGGGQRIAVHATSAVVLDRSESWSSGWQASLQPVAPAGSGAAGGPPRPVSVTRDGLVQRVVIPGAGDYRVTFTYRPTSARVAIVVSAATVGALVLWAVAEVAGRRWRRRRRARPPGRPELNRG